MYCFVSHSSKDSEVALGLCRELEKNGMGCFYAPRDIRSGYEYAEEIMRGIDSTDVVILILSSNSNISPHVLREVERAVSKNIPLIVYRIEDVILTKSMEYFLMSHQWLNGKTESYMDIVNAVRNMEEKESSETVKKQETGVGKKKLKLPVVAGICGIALCIVLGAILGFYFGTRDKKVEKPMPKNVELGDEIVFGKYNGQPIYWQVLSISDDKTEAILISKDIITMKAFDAADSDRYNEHDGESYYSADSKANTDLDLQAFVRGNSDWENSDIRAWLNGETNIVDYGDSAPTKKKMCEMNNGYDMEPGFLSNFKDKEIEAIKTTTVETVGNELRQEQVVVTEDKVFLLSVEELELFKQASVSMLTKPTQECLEQDESKWYQYEQSEHGSVMFYWWLRDPVSGYSSKCYMVGTEYWDEKVLADIAGFGGIGIRPAITVDLTSDAIVIEE